MERKVPKYENHKLRERKVKILKGIEEITKGQAHTNTRKLYRDISTGMAVFLNQKSVNVCEHTTKTASLESVSVPPGAAILNLLTNSFYLLDSVLALISDNFPPSIPLATPWWHLS